MACWLLLTSDSAVAVVTEELSVSDSDLSSGLNPSPKVSPAADTLQDQQETVSTDTHQDERIEPFSSHDSMQKVKASQIRNANNWVSVSRSSTIATFEKVIFIFFFCQSC